MFDALPSDVVLRKQFKVDVTYQLFVTNNNLQKSQLTVYRMHLSDQTLQYPYEDQICTYESQTAQFKVRSGNWSGGDAVFDFSLSKIYQKHISSGSLISLISVEISSQWGLILENDQGIDGFVRDQKVKYISASDNERDNKGYIYSGIAFININTFEKINLEKSIDFECDLYSKFIKSGQLSNIKANGFWFSIDTPKDITLISNEQGHIGKHLKRIGENIMEYINLEKRTV